MVSHFPVQTPSSAAFREAMLAYDRVMQDNVAERVRLMSEEDLQRYATQYNTVSASPKDVLAHMQRWGGQYQLIASGALVRGSSDLFNRLLAGSDPLPYPPPRTSGNRPWFELFDQPGPLPVVVKWGGISRRQRDHGVLCELLVINDCPWELRLQDQPEETADWLKALKHLGHVEIHSALQIRLHVRFGRWPEPFVLTFDFSEMSGRLVIQSLENLLDIARSRNTKISLLRPWPVPNAVRLL